jgi:hypothetical protein
MVVRARGIHSAFVRHTLATKNVSSVRHSCSFVNNNSTKRNEVYKLDFGRL